jgi:hypothetical protein
MTNDSKQKGDGRSPADAVVADHDGGGGEGGGEYVGEGVADGEGVGEGVEDGGGEGDFCSEDDDGMMP